MQQQPSYLNDTWQSGSRAGTPIHDATTGAVIASASSAGLDLAAALRHAREVGGPAMCALTFRERGTILSALSKAIRDDRDALLDVAAPLVDSVTRTIACSFSDRGGR